MIKNLIFDVGEVLLEYRWTDMLMDYGLSHAEAKRIGEELFHKPIWADGLEDLLQLKMQLKNTNSCIRMI